MLRDAWHWFYEVALLPLVAAVVIISVLAMAGCAARATIQHIESITTPDGTTVMTRTIVTAPKDNIESAQLVRRHGETLASTGAGQGFDQALDQLGSYLIPAGMMLVLVGGLGLSARIKFFAVPFFGRMPKGISVACIVIGGGFIATPMFLSKYLWLIALGLCVVAALGIGALVSWLDNGKILPVREPAAEQTN